MQLDGTRVINLLLLDALRNVFSLYSFTCFFTSAREKLRRISSQSRGLQVVVIDEVFLNVTVFLLTYLKLSEFLSLL